MQSGGRVEVPQRLNFGAGSISTVDVNTRTFAYIAANTAPAGSQFYQGHHPQPLANSPGLTPLEAAARSDADIVVYLCSTNDRTAGVALVTSQANVAAAVARLRQAGKIVVRVAELPRGDAANTAQRLSGQQLSYHLRMAQWLRNVRQPGVYVVDPWPALALATSASGDALAGAMADGLHFGFPAALVTGGMIAKVVNAIVPPLGGLMPASNADAWSADNPSGALDANPMLGAIGVTPQAAAGVTITGQLPASWQHNPINASGVTVAYGTAVVDGTSHLSVTLSGTPTGANPRLDIYSTIGSPPIAGLAAGDTIRSHPVKAAADEC